MFTKFWRLFRIHARKDMKLMAVPVNLPDTPVVAAIVTQENGHKVAVIVLTDYTPQQLYAGFGVRVQLTADALSMLPDAVLQTFGPDVLQAAMECVTSGEFKLEHIGSLNVSPN